MHLLQIDWTTAARSWWTCLDWVLRCAARLIGCMPKYGSVSAYMRDTLHWLPIAQRISYSIAVLVWRCLLGSAPGYLCELCRPVSGPPGRRALRSSVTGHSGAHQAYSKQAVSSRSATHLAAEGMRCNDYPIYHS